MSASGDTASASTPMPSCPRPAMPPPAQRRRAPISHLATPKEQLLAKVLAHARQPVHRRKIKGQPVLEILGVLRLATSPVGDGTVDCWALELHHGRPAWRPAGDAHTALAPTADRSHWLRVHASLHLHRQRLAARQVGMAPPPAVDVAELQDLVHWLHRRVRRAVDLVAMKSAVAEALALDPALLRLSCYLFTLAESPTIGWVSVAAWNTAARHRLALEEVERHAPAVMPMLGSLLMAGHAPGRDGLDAVPTVIAFLKQRGIRRNTWRLALRGGRRRLLAVRQWYRGPLHEAMAEHLLVLQAFGLKRPPEPEVIDSIWSRDGNSIFRWREYRDEICPSAAVYGHVARVYQQVKAVTPAADRPALREALHRVVGWVHGAGVRSLDVGQRSEGWRWLIRAAQDWRDDQDARQRLTRHWPVPEPITVGRYRLVALESELALRDEGRAMHHCALLRASLCAQGQALLMSVRCAQTGRRVATVQYDGLKNGQPTLNAVRGPVNSDPPAGVMRAVLAAQKAVGAWLASRPTVMSASKPQRR